MKTAAWADGKRGVFLVIFKQPGANVIETVDRIKAQFPRLIAAIPPAIKIKIMSDRTVTIRAAIEEVQITLLITIALVVIVIFVFLRSFWATFIPSVTVPLSLLGACSLMWAFGYMLDNLSLMALTILFVDLDELSEIIDAEAGEGGCSLFAEPEHGCC
jgi:HAE1 family hydrophobic/amphiphilic exporter-1